MLADFRHALRSLARSPGFTAACVLVLALGIGANTAIFSVVEAALLRPLPFPQADRLVRLYEAFDDSDARANTLNLSELTVRQWREHGRDIFTDLAAATGGAVTLGRAGDAPARTLPAARISANFFSTVGLLPTLGRNFTADEDRPGGPRVVIVSHDFWQRELGGRADALGRTITLDDAPSTVIGVMPKNFRHPYRAEVWVPLAAAFDPAGSRGHYLYGAARLRPGVTLEQADAAVRRLCASLNSAAPDPQNPHRAYIRPLREGFIVDLQPKLLVIAAAAFCALLIAAANFAGLLLARTIAREGELAIRAALGASRARLLRGLVAQALVLAALGTAAGLLLASWLTPALVALSPEGSDATGSAMREFDFGVRLDWPAFAFAIGALLFAGAFGLLPAWRGARTDLRTAMNGAGRSATLDRGTQRLLSALVVGEIAAAAVLLVGAVVLTQYFSRLVNEPWGFATEHRLTFNTILPSRLFATPDARLRALDRTLGELRALPGVHSASVTLPHPLYSARQLVSNNPEGTPPPEPRGFHLAYLRAAAPGYFATAGQTLLRGRDFTDADRGDTDPVCIINESFARRFWSGQDALGRRVKLGRVDGPRPWLKVVGVVADTKVLADPNDGEIDGTLCLPIPQVLALSAGFNEFTFVLETAGEPRALESAARAALTYADSRLAAYEMNSIAATAAESRVTERFALVLVSLFGALGLVLAAIGLYGLLSLHVARRTREFGIRSALGATAAGMVQLVAAQGVRLLALGFLVGAAGAWVALRFAHARWPELSATNPLPFLAAAAVLAVAVTLACWFPARRAARVDPIIALHAD
jgi:putative ABC transport system permease protein